MNRAFKIRMILIIAFVLIALKGRAQKYSLQDCISTALKQNEQVKNGELDVTSTKHMVKEVKGSLMPNINLTGQYLYYTELPSQFVNAAAFGGQDGEYKRVTLSVPQTTSAYLTVSQNLYNQTIMTGLQAARAVQHASYLQLGLTKENVIYNVTATYYTIQALQDNVVRIKENIDNLERSVKINAVLKDNEIVAASIHNRLLINLENLKNQYENQKLSLDKNVTLLKYLMRVELDAPVEVDALNYDDLLYTPAIGDLSKRTDIQLQKEQIKLSRLDKKSIVAGYYPTLTSGMSFGYAGYNDSFAPAERINNDWINSQYFSLTLRIPVFDGFQKRYQVKQREITIQKDINTLSMMNTNAEREVSDALKNYETNKKLFVSSKTNLDLAHQLFNTSQTEYETGITTLTDLLNVQNDLSNARNNYSTALLNLKQAELGFKKANGELLTNETEIN